MGAQSAVLDFTYSSRSPIESLETGETVKLVEDWGSFSAGDVIAYSGSTLTDFEFTDATDTQAGFTLVTATYLDLSDSAQSYSSNADWTLVSGSVGSVTAGSDIVVRADDSGNLRSDINLEASSTVTNNMDAFRRIAAQILEKDVKFTTKSGTHTVEVGDILYIASDFSEADERGKIYKFLGQLVDDDREAQELTLDALTGTDLTGTDSNWEVVQDLAALDGVFSNVGNLAASDSYATGITLVTNEVDANASAKVANIAVSSAVDHSVAGSSSSLMLAKHDRLFLQDDVAGFTAGSVLIYNGTSVLLGNAGDLLTDNADDFVTVTETGHDITVSATENAAMLALLQATVSSSEAVLGGQAMTKPTTSWSRPTWSGHRRQAPSTMQRLRPLPVISTSRRRTPLF